MISKFDGVKRRKRTLLSDWKVFPTVKYTQPEEEGSAGVLTFLVVGFHVLAVTTPRGSEGDKNVLCGIL